MEFSNYRSDAGERLFRPPGMPGTPFQLLAEDKNRTADCDCDEVDSEDDSGPSMNLKDGAAHAQYREKTCLECTVRPPCIASASLVSDLPSAETVSFPELSGRLGPFKTSLY